MLNVFFNPYPGMAADYDAGKKSLLSTANTYWKLSQSIKFEFEMKNPEGNDAIKCFSLAEDKQGARYTPSSFLREYSGRERELIIFFFSMIGRGSQIKNEDLLICEDWELTGFNFSAPLLEYALRQDGMAVTISDDKDWKADFFSFLNQPHELPNIHGQEDCLPLQNWIRNWVQRNHSFTSSLEQNFNIIFCSGATNKCFPSRHEEEGLINSLNHAQNSKYKVDNDLIKIIQTKNGNILELRSYGDGVRMFFKLYNGRPVVGGFYRKSGSVRQNKASEYAAKRIKDRDME